MSNTGGSGGGKRSRPSGPKTHIQSDFSKRPKAKVGKRARKPANVTDTKFRAASVKVKAQDAIGRTGSGATAAGGGDASSDVAASLTSLELESSRGKSLSLLLSTLNHHSSVVRLSSLGGLKDAIAPHRVSIAAVRANLNAIVPALGRSCCVDDDDEVRKAALELFGEIAARVGGEDDGAPFADGGDDAAKKSKVTSRHLSPYLPLLVAYVTSALNSLDVSIRLDGARAVEILIKVMGMSEVGRPQYVKDMLPAYVRVMVDAKAKGTEDSRPTSGTVSAAAAAKSSDKKKKNKKGSKEKAKDSAQNAKSAAVLRSLVLLLKAAVASSTCAGSNAGEWEVEANDGKNLIDLRPSLSQPDLTFVRGGTASNALLAHRTGTAVNTNSLLSSLDALVSESNYQQVSGGDAAGMTPNAAMSIEVQVELFGRLRDRLVELSQAGHFVGRGRGAGGDGNTGLCLSQSYLEEMHVIISAVRLIWSMYSRSLVAAYTPAPGKKKSGEDALPKKLRSVTSAIHSQFISMLPLVSGDGGGRSDGNQDSSRYDAANAILCSAVGELGCVLERKSTPKSQKASDSEPMVDGASSVWTNTVFAYVLPRLDTDSEAIVDVTILKVVGQLIFGPFLDSEPKRRKELIGKFGETFFPSDGNVNQNVCTSASGRLASMILVDLMLKFLSMPTSKDATSSDAHQTRQLVGSMAQVLPSYLLHWEDQFLQQSATVLSTLMSIVRRYRTGSPLTVEGGVIEVFEDNGNSTETAQRDEDPIALLVKSLRSTIGILFEQPKKSKSKKDEKTASLPSLRQQSIFECMPDEIQHLILGLFGLLQYPQDSNVTALAKICTRSSIDDVMKDYIMDVMYSIRRTLPMQLFLTFLVNSSGLPSIKKAKKKKEGGPEGDGANVQPADIFHYDLAIERLCRAIVRCGGSSILPMFVPLLSSWLGNSKDTQSSPQIATEVQRRAVFAILACMSYGGTAELDKKLKTAVTEASISIFYRNIEDKDDQERLLAPVVGVMMNQPNILSSTLESLIASVAESSENDLQGLIRSFLYLVKNSALGITLKEQGNADQLENLGQVIEKKVAGGPLDRLGGALSTEIQIHIGRKVGGA